ncbi:MAG: hypothetical protein NT029_16510 [Armatimonadetes bacterium]|nr:hypothetical protein [Armatimonadota bacterium]
MNPLAPILALALISPANQPSRGADQSFLGIFAETSVMKMAGMPAMPEIPDMPELPDLSDLKLPDGVKLPGGLKLPGGGAPAGMMIPGKPQRKLEVRLWSPGLAPAEATAALAVPAGLKLGKKLDLALYRPKPEESAGGGGETPGGMAASFTIKRYWGSSPTVKPGQPEVITFDGLTAEQKAAFREQARQPNAARSYFYKPDWTTGYWPAGKAPAGIAKGAELEGRYALASTYTGNVEIDVPAKVNFLDPIEFSAPDLAELPDLTAALGFRWKAVPNVLGYHMQVMGIQGKNILIIWSSSEIKTAPGNMVDYMQMADVIKGVKETSMMAPDRVDVTVPADIFADCDMVFGTMVGFGPGAALPEGQPLPRVQTKSTVQLMLGGKLMKEGMKP